MNEREHLLTTAVETGGNGTANNRERIAYEVNDLLGVLELLGIPYGQRDQIEAKKPRYCTSWNIQ